MSQAALPRAVWNLAVRVMNLYENGMLKGQKLNLSSLLAKPEFRQQHLAPIRAMNADDQCTLLEKVIDKEISLTELKTEASQMKSVSALKVAFVRLTNSESWEKATETYPAFANERQLKRFTSCNLKKEIPQSFQDYCSRAKSSLESSVSNEAVFSFSADGLPTSVTVIESKPTEVSGQLISSINESFCGADLGLILVDEVFD